MNALKENSVSDLYQLWRDYKKQAESIIEKADLVLGALNDKLAEQFKNIYEAEGKTTGEISLEIDGIKVLCDRSKKVEWDDKKLREIANLLPPEKVEAVIHSKLSIPEKVFSVLNTLIDEDTELYKKIMEARTVKVGTPKIKFGRE